MIKEAESSDCGDAGLDANLASGELVPKNEEHQLQDPQQMKAPGATIIGHFGQGDIHYHITCEGKGDFTDALSKLHLIQDQAGAVKALTYDKDGTTPQDLSISKKRENPTAPANVQPIKIIEPTITAGCAHLGKGDMYVGSGGSAKGSPTTQASPLKHTESSRDQGEKGKSKITKTITTITKIGKCKVDPFIEKVNEIMLRNTEHDVRSTFKNLKKPKRDVFPGLSLINLALQQPTKALESEYVPEVTHNLKPGIDEQPVAIDNLHGSERGESAAHHVMVLGDAGDGKTTVAMRYARLALEGKVKELKGIKMVHFVRASKLNVQDVTTVFELLFHQQMTKMSKELMKAGRSWIRKTPSEVLLVIDGLDQCEADFEKDYCNIDHDSKAKAVPILYNLFQGRIYPGMWILTTTRWHVFWKLSPDAKPHRTIALRGYNTSTVEYLLSSFIGERGLEVLGHLKTKSPILLPLCETPMFLVFVSEVMMQKDADLPDSLSSILLSVLSCFSSSEHRSRSCPDLLQKLMLMAFKGIKHKKVLFSYSYVTSLGLDINDVRDLVITDAVPERFRFRVIDGDKELYFCHQSIQEVLAALRICKMDIKDLKQTLSSLLEETHMEVVRRFVYGIFLNEKNMEKASKLLKGVSLNDLQKKKKLVSDRAKLLVQKRKISDIKTLSLLHECGPTLFECHESNIREIHLVNAVLKPSDVLAVLLVAQKSKYLKGIYFGNLVIDSKSLDLFKGCLDTLENIKMRSLQIGGSQISECVDFTDFWTKCVHAGATQMSLDMDRFTADINRENKLEVAIGKALSEEELAILFGLLKTKPASSVLLNFKLSPAVFSQLSRWFEVLDNKVDVMKLSEANITDPQCCGIAPLLMQKKIGRLSIDCCDIDFLDQDMKIEMKEKLNDRALLVILDLLKSNQTSATMTHFGSLDSLLYLLTNVAKKFNIRFNRVELCPSASWLKAGKQMVCEMHLGFLSADDSSVISVSANHSEGNRTFHYLANLLKIFRSEKLMLKDDLIQINYDKENEIESFTFSESSEALCANLIRDTGVTFFKVEGFSFKLEKNKADLLPCFVLDETMIAANYFFHLWKLFMKDEARLKIGKLELNASWDKVGKISNLKVGKVESETVRVFRSVLHTNAALAQINVDLCVIDATDHGAAIEELAILKDLTVYHDLQIKFLDVKNDTTSSNKLICHLLGEPMLKTVKIGGTQFHVERHKYGKVKALVFGNLQDATNLIEFIQKAKIATIKTENYIIDITSTPGWKHLKLTMTKYDGACYASLFSFVKDYGADECNIDGFHLSLSFKKGHKKTVALSFNAVYIQEEELFSSLCNFVMNCGASKKTINGLSFKNDAKVDDQLQVDILTSDQFSLMNKILSVVKPKTLQISRCEIFKEDSSSLQPLLEVQQLAEKTKLQIIYVLVKGYPHREADQVFETFSGIEVNHVEVECTVNGETINIIYEEAHCSIGRISMRSLCSFLEDYTPDSVKSLAIMSCYLPCNVGHSITNQLYILRQALQSHSLNIQIESLVVYSDVLGVLADVLEVTKLLKIKRLEADGVTFSFEVQSDDEDPVQDMKAVVEFVGDAEHLIDALKNVRHHEVTITKLSIPFKSKEQVTQQMDALASIRLSQLSNLVILTLEIEEDFSTVGKKLVQMMNSCQFNFIITNDIELRINSNDMSMISVPNTGIEGLKQLIRSFDGLNIASLEVGRLELGPPNNKRIEEQLRAIKELSPAQLESMMNVLLSMSYEQTEKELKLLKDLASQESMKIQVNPETRHLQLLHSTPLHIDFKISMMVLQDRMFKFESLLDLMKHLTLGEVESPNEKFKVVYADNDRVHGFESVYTCDLSKFWKFFTDSKADYATIDWCEINRSDCEEALELISSGHQNFKVGQLKLDSFFTEFGPDLVKLIKRDLLDGLETSDFKFEVQRNELGKFVGLEIHELPSSQCEDVHELMLAAKYLETSHCFLQLETDPVKILVHVVSEDTMAAIKNVMDIATLVQSNTVELLNMSFEIKYDSMLQVQELHVSEATNAMWEDLMQLVQHIPTNLVIDSCEFDTLEGILQSLDELGSLLECNSSSIRIKNFKVGVFHSEYLKMLIRLLYYAEVTTLSVCRYIVKGDMSSVFDQLPQNSVYDCMNVQVHTLLIPCRISEVKEYVLNSLDVIDLQRLVYAGGQCAIKHDQDGKVTDLVFSFMGIEEVCTFLDCTNTPHITIDRCDASSESICALLESPLPDNIQVCTLHLHSRFLDIPDVLKIGALTRAQCLSTYDGISRFKYEDGKMTGIEFQCTNVSNWQKYYDFLQKLEINVPGIDNLWIHPKVDDDSTDELKMAAELVSNSSLTTQVDYIQFGGSLVESMEDLLEIARKTQTKYLKTTEAEFRIEYLQNDEFMQLTVAKLGEKEVMRLFAALLREKIVGGVDIAKLLTRLKEYFTTMKIKLMVTVILLERGFCGIARQILAITRVVPVQKVTASDMTVNLDYDADGQLTGLNISHLLGDQCKAIVGICKAAKIKNLNVESWESTQNNDGISELGQLVETLADTDISIKVMRAKMSSSFYSNASTCLGHVEKIGMLQLECPDGSFQFGYNECKKISTVEVSELRISDLAAFTELFAKMELVTIGRIVVDHQEAVPRDDGLGLTKTLKNLTKSFEVFGVKFQQNLTEIPAISEMLSAQFRCVEAADAQVHYDVGEKVKIVEVFETAYGASRLVAEIIRMMKPTCIKLFNCELELKYHENGKKQMIAHRNHNLNEYLHRDLRNIAGQAGIDHGFLTECDSRHMCKLEDEAYGGAGYPYFTEYLPLEQGGVETVYEDTVQHQAESTYRIAMEKSWPNVAYEQKIFPTGSDELPKGRRRFPPPPHSASFKQVSSTYNPEEPYVYDN